jgi:hypothetical protein
MNMKKLEEGKVWQYLDTKREPDLVSELKHCKDTSISMILVQ